MNVYILTEITKRELDSNILLACIAADSFEVMISNSDTIKNLNLKNTKKEFFIQKFSPWKKKKILAVKLKRMVIK